MSDAGTAYEEFWAALQEVGETTGVWFCGDGKWRLDQGRAFGSSFREAFFTALKEQGYAHRDAISAAPSPSDLVRVPVSALTEEECHAAAAKIEWTICAVYHNRLYYPAWHRHDWDRAYYDSSLAAKETQLDAMQVALSTVLQLACEPTDHVTMTRDAARGREVGDDDLAS
jgi:hypothetical protein